MKEILKDPKSYDPVEFSKLDSLFESPIEEDISFGRRKDRYPLIGYTMKHKYRARNGYGGLDFWTTTFVFNKDIDSIVYYSDDK